MRARRTDQNHAAVLDAIRALGYPCMSLHAHGKGLEDILVAFQRTAGSSYDFRTHTWTRVPYRGWLLVEVKVSRNKSGTVPPSAFTEDQREWYARTEGWPRLVVTSAQDAVIQLQELARG